MSPYSRGELFVADEVAQLRQERDLYLGLLSLGKQRDLEAFLEHALKLIVELTGARQGYIELSIDGPDGKPRTWSIAHAYTPESIEDVRSRISRGIIAEAMASGTTVLTPSALLDDRFSARESVRAAEISAVLCAPVGAAPPLGAIYLEGTFGDSTFEEKDRVRAELFGEHLAPLAERLVLRELSGPENDSAASLQRALRCNDFVGRSRAYVELLEQVNLIAPLDVHVLLTGDSGTGKTQLARIIHTNSRRTSGPFVELNCAALPESLIENELFGAVSGGHSTAQSPVEGKIGAADHGTLLLDEVGELPLAAQAKLLQFLQSKQYYRLGSARATTADVRVVAATNADLRTAVAERRFREDLLYRLEVLPICVPTLAERAGDVELMAEYFCDSAIRRHRLRVLKISPGARRAIAAAEWPGNVRQLEHAVEAAAIRAAGSGALTIEAQHVFPKATTAGSNVTEETFQAATRKFQEDLLRRTLARYDWNVTECARRLDLARSHVYNLIRAFGLERGPQ